jgi:hypothetical protein
MRGIQQISSLRNIKSIRSVGARSIPKVQRSSYLDLYILRREKDRLEKEAFALDKRKTAADKQLNSIAKRIERLQKETQDDHKVKTYRGISARPLKTMAIKY